MKIKDIEERLIKRIEKRLIPRLTKKIVSEIRKEEYPPESQFKKQFVKEVKAAKKRIREGKGRTYTYEEFKKKFLKGR